MPQDSIIMEENSLDVFLQEIQKEKMKELWGNFYDEFWEDS